MARYTITHICGHKAMHRAHGPRSYRDKNAAWLERQPCEKCKRLGTQPERVPSQVEAVIAVAVTRRLRALTFTA